MRLTTKGVSRRTVLRGAAACALVSSPALRAAVKLVDGPAPLELITDSHFRTGVNMWCTDDAPGSTPTRAGILCPAHAVCTPAWDGGQWASHFDIGKAAPETLPSGAVRYFDGGKSFTFGPQNTPEADLSFALNGRKEYNDIAPTAPGGWPHFLLEQRFSKQPSFATFRAVPFHISYRLLWSVAHQGPGWNPAQHTAQFTFYVTLRNGNNKSPGFGDYLWFGVPMYDARYRLPRKYAAEDVGNAKKRATNKFIFDAPGKVFTSTPAASGRWITIEHDLLRLMNEALDTAWSAGFLAESRNKQDFVLGEMNIGWEITGPIDAAMQIRDLSLQVVCDGASPDNSFNPANG